jgi:phosphate transport system ATP-binding protein
MRPVRYLLVQKLKQQKITYPVILAEPIRSVNGGKTMAEEIITSKDLHLYYGKKEALKGIDLSIKKGEITAMIGPSGCGKSTYLRSLNRMNDLIPGVTITGSVVYKGKDIYSPKQDIVDLRKEIGMVFQQPNPFPFSIYENVIYGLKLKGVTDKAILDKTVEESLKAASVWEDVKDKLHQSALSLSGGQQQRVCIARVLAVDPEIILLDEPTSALDPISSGKIENTLLALKERYTMIIVTHNMSQASRISDKTAFFLDGNLIEFNDTKKVFLSPSKKETEDYISGRFG